jgi:hypothetical protein
MNIIPTDSDKIVVYYSNLDSAHYVAKWIRSVLEANFVSTGSAEEDVKSTTTLFESLRWQVRRGSEKPAKGFGPAYVYEAETDSLVSVATDNVEVPEHVWQRVWLLAKDPTYQQSEPERSITDLKGPYSGLLAVIDYQKARLARAE